MTTKQQTLEDILIACAGATVPCVRCKGIGTVYHTPGPAYLGQEGLICEGCGRDDEDTSPNPGIGRSYFLPDEVRVPCKAAHIRACYGPDVADQPIVVTGGVVTCSEAGCRSWVPNPDRDVWQRVWRAIRGNLNVSSRYSWSGDFVIAQLEDGRDHIIGTREGLFGWPAEAEAMRRAIEQVPGVEMGK